MRDRFAASPEELMRDKRVSKGHVIATYLALQMHVAGREGECFPGHDRLAEMSHNSVSTVKRDISELIALGYLKKRTRQGTSNFYDVRWSAQGDLESGQGEPGGSGQGDLRRRTS